LAQSLLTMGFRRVVTPPGQVDDFDGAFGGSEKATEFANFPVDVLDGLAFAVAVEADVDFTFLCGKVLQFGDEVGVAFFPLRGFGSDTAGDTGEGDGGVAQCE